MVGIRMVDPVALGPPLRTGHRRVPATPGIQMVDPRHQYGKLGGFRSGWVRVLEPLVRMAPLSSPTHDGDSRLYTANERLDISIMALYICAVWAPQLFLNRRMRASPDIAGFPIRLVAAKIRIRQITLSIGLPT